jgi:hypothetical protein
MLYSESERAWLDRRAVEVAERTGWPEPIARSEAAAEIVRMRQRSACKVVVLGEWQHEACQRGRAGAEPGR